MSNDIGPPHLDKELSIPWQIKLIYWFGMPALIALYLIWYGTSKLDRTINDMEKNLSECTKISVAMSREIIEQHKQMDLLRDEMSETLVRICVNTARDGNQRAQCFAPRK